MKTFIISIFIIIALLSSKCQQIQNSETKNASVINFKNSECLTERKTFSSESISFKYIDNSQIAVIHKGVTFNCCPGKLSAESVIKGDTIFLNEKESEAGCKCLCQYNLDYTLTDISLKNYVIVIENMGRRQAELKLNFTSKTDTTVVIKKE